MKRYLKILLLAAALMMSAIMIDPPGGIPIPTGKRIPIPGKPPIIVVFPGSK